MYHYKLKPCPKGKERNPKTGRCITIKNKTVKNKTAKSRTPVTISEKLSSPKKQLIVNPEDIYYVGNTKLFKYKVGDVTYRDNYVELEKNLKPILVSICRYCKLNYKGLKKKQLLDLIKNSNCFVVKS